MMMIKIPVSRFVGVLSEEIPSDYEEVYKELIVSRFSDTSRTYLNPYYSSEYERYSMIDKIRTMVSHSHDDYIYVDYDMVLWMEKEGL